MAASTRGVHDRGRNAAVQFTPDICLDCQETVEVLGEKLFVADFETVCCFQEHHEFQDARRIQDASREKRILVTEADVFAKKEVLGDVGLHLRLDVLHCAILLLTCRPDGV